MNCWESADHPAAGLTPSRRKQTLSQNAPEHAIALRAQYRACNEPFPDAKASAFEKGVCKQLGMVCADYVTVEDFRTDRRIELASNLADLGLPDILEWRQDQFGFAADLASVQDRSVALLESLLPAISQSSVERRLRLLHFAVSIACLNHPGSKRHEEAIQLAAKAADLAGLHEILATKHRRAEIHVEAFRLSLHLKTSFFIPTLNSPTNYMQYLLRGRRMTAGTWASIERHVDEAIVVADAMVKINPGCQRALRERISTLTMKARLLAALGDSASLSEADRLYKRSCADEERLQVPYGFLYPIVRDVARGKPRLAILKTEKAVAAFQTTGNHAATRAFAALLVHLTEKATTRMTNDRSLLALANEAAKSPAIQYQHSHVFGISHLRSRRKPEPA